MRLKDILAQKKGDLYTIVPEKSVLQAIREMCNRKIGALLVQTGDGRPLGILTERDVLQFCSDRGEKLERTAVSEIMTQDLIVLPPDAEADEAMSIMTQHKIRHLPVIDKDRITGMISIGDLVKAKLEQTAFEVKYLRDYIAS